MINCNSASTPIESGLKLTKDLGGKKINITFFKQIVGCLMYLTATRPNIMYVVSLLSRYILNIQKILNLLAAKRILRYLQLLTGYQ